MNLSCRLILLDSSDTLHRLPLSIMSELTAYPPRIALPLFAGKRVRGAEILVELVGRKPSRAIRASFFNVPFDQRGALDRTARMKYLAALLDEPSMGGRSPSQVVVIDATSRFIAAGGRWNPSRRLEFEVVEAALGNRRIRLLSHRDAVALDSA